MNTNSVITKSELKWLTKNVKTIYVSMPHKDLRSFKREFGENKVVYVVDDKAKTSHGIKMKYAPSYIISLVKDNAPTKRLREMITYAELHSNNKTYSYPRINNSNLAIYLVNNYPDNFSIKQK